MKLYKTKEGSGNRVIITYKESDLHSLIQESSELDYIRERIAKDKAVTIWPANTNSTTVQVLKNDHKNRSARLEHARLAAHDLFDNLKDHDANKITIVNNGVLPEEIMAFLEGLYLTNYRFCKYFTNDSENSFELQEAAVVSDGITENDLLFLTASLEGNLFCRDLVNEPLSYLTAEKLAEEIAEHGKLSGYTTEVFNKKKIESLRMGGLLAVNKGSIDPPTFSILEWKPSDAVNKKPYILVGKGVVYDTGGLSLKPTYDSMDYMKCDMAGAAAVAGAFYAISKAKLPVHIIGLVPATDNRPDGNAYVPGDVVKMHNGSTVEVLNTDAEGRMILADALSYATQFDPELVIELSTLTGAAHAAIGKYAMVGMGNADQAIMNDLKEAGMETFERIAEFPFWDDYAETLKSDIADQKNMGGKYAGAITAGKFLEKFTNYPYIHLDIAGPSYNKTADKYRGKGGSGVGVRLLFEYFKRKSSQTT